jgi:hypothetical protein
MKVVSPQYIKPAAKNTKASPKTTKVSAKPIEAFEEDIEAPNKHLERLWRAAQIIALLSLIASVLVFLLSD